MKKGAWAKGSGALFLETGKRTLFDCMKEVETKMKKRSSILYSKKAAPWIFILPFLLSFCVLWIYPLGSTIVMSFQKIEPAKTSFVGFENYTKLLKDTAFHTAVGNSFEYMLLTCLILIPLPMLFAVLMDSNLVKAKGFWKAVLYLPALTSVVISGTYSA